MQVLRPQRTFSHHSIDRPAVAIACDENAYLLVRYPAFRRFAAALAWRAVELARSLVGFEHIHFIGFGDAAQLGRAVIFSPREEAMAPAKRGRVRNAELGRRAAHAARTEHAVEVVEPWR